jgi:NADH-quinone oxidoreductase subunit B
MGRLDAVGTEPVIADSSDMTTLTSRFESVLAWAQKNSLYMNAFVTACCRIEFMSVSGPRYDVARFGAEVPRFSPRQSDLLWVIGTVSQRQAPVLRRVYEQMAEPKWVMAVGSCASTGGFYDNYATVAGIDKLIPVDVYIPGCPPRPEGVLDGLMLLQDKIQKGDRTTAIVKPRYDPTTEPSRGLVSIRHLSR